MNPPKISADRPSHVHGIDIIQTMAPKHNNFGVKPKVKTTRLIQVIKTSNEYPTN